MRKLLTAVIPIMAVAALAFGASGVMADDDDDKGKARSDFALFDGTNPSNLNADSKTGVVCGVSNKKGTKLRKGAFTYHFTATNDGSGPLECKIIYKDGDFVRHKVPLGTTINISGAGGSGDSDKALRWDCDANLSGGGSLLSDKKYPFCVSCDANDGFCDLIVAN